MDKKEMIDALDEFSQNLLMTLADVNAIKNQVQDVMDENVSLRMENAKLRERLFSETKDGISPANFGKENLEKMYEEGFHVCNDGYGRRWDNDEPCLFCLELLNRE